MTGLHILAIIFWVVWGVCSGTLYERNKGSAMTSNALSFWFWGSLLAALIFSLIAASSFR
jgi:hypothetical protein